jgi:hypothetical protein
LRELDGFGWWFETAARVTRDFYSGHGFDWVIDNVPEWQVWALSCWGVVTEPRVFGAVRVRNGYVGREVRRVSE